MTDMKLLPDTSDIEGDDPVHPDTDESPDKDIDPSDWLAGKADQDAGEDKLVGWANIPSLGVRMRMAALTEEEHVSIQKLARRRDKTDPKRFKLDQSAYKCLFISTALNKAKGIGLGQPGYIAPEQLAARPTGELNELMKQAMQISGMDTTPVRPDTSELFT